MHIKVRVWIGKATFAAVLTTEHAASIYGMPVVLLHGNPYGPADLPPGYGIELPDGISLADKAVVREAGYSIAVLIP